MNYLIFVSTLVFCTLADGYLYSVPLQQLQAPLIVVNAQQQPVFQTNTHPQQQQQQQQHEKIQHYFTQDALGQYSYGYLEPLSTKQEIRTLDGKTSGSYTYIDANGLLQTVDYTADEDGFHVAATNLPKHNYDAPQPVEETAEVAAAREQHLAAHKAILEGNRSASSILPKPVEDTNEVAEAKKEFFARFAAEQEKHKLLKETALLRSQNIFVSSASKASKTSLPGIIGGYAYGYRFNGAIKPTPYYLPID